MWCSSTQLISEPSSHTSQRITKFTNSVPTDGPRLLEPLTMLTHRGHKVSYWMPVGLSCSSGDFIQSDWGIKKEPSCKRFTTSVFLYVSILKQRWNRDAQNDEPTVIRSVLWALIGRNNETLPGGWWSNWFPVPQEKVFVSWKQRLHRPEDNPASEDN